MANGKEIVLVISDFHAPFEHPHAVEFLKEVKRKYKPTKIVCIGDEIDAHALGRWPKNPDGMSIGDELALAVDRLRPLYKEFPYTMVCTSNHTSRPYKSAFEHGISRRLLKDYNEWLDAPVGWIWKDSWEIDGVLYLHGDNFTGKNGALKAAEMHRQSVVIGHAHSYGGVTYSNTRNGQIFGVNSGCLINTDAYSFEYGKYFAAKPTIGCAVIFGGKYAIFIPME